MGEPTSVSKYQWGMTVEPSHSLVMRILRCLLMRNIVSGSIVARVQSGKMGGKTGVEVPERVFGGAKVRSEDDGGER